METGQDGIGNRRVRHGGGPLVPAKKQRKVVSTKKDVTVKSTVTRSSSEEAHGDDVAEMPDKCVAEIDDMEEQQQQEQESKSEDDDEPQGKRAGLILVKEDGKWLIAGIETISKTFSQAATEIAWTEATLALGRFVNSAKTKGFSPATVIKHLSTSMNDIQDTSFLEYWDSTKSTNKIKSTMDAVQFVWKAGDKDSPKFETILQVVDLKKAATEAKLHIAIEQATLLFGLHFPDLREATRLAYRAAVDAASAKFPNVPRPAMTEDGMKVYVKQVTSIARNHMLAADAATSTKTTPPSVVQNEAPAVPASSASTVAVVYAQDRERRGRGGGRGGSSRGAGRARAGGPLCFRCGGVGHMQRVCPSKGGNDQTSGGNGEVKNQSNRYVYSSFYSGLLSLAVVEPLSVMGLVSSGRSCTFSQRVWIDSGAAPAMASPKLCERLRVKVLPSRASHVTSVSGERIVVEGEVAFRVCIGGAWRALTALVVESPFECLLGVRVMRQFGVSIKFDKRRASVRVSGGQWVVACKPSDESQKTSPLSVPPSIAESDESRKAALSPPDRVVGETPAQINLVVGCEARVAQVLRAESEREGSVAKPWTLPQLAAASMHDDGEDVFRRIGQPELTGADVDAYRLVKFGDLSPAGLAEGRAIAEEYRQIFGGTRGEGSSTVPPLCNIDKQIQLTLKPDADLSQVKAHAGRVSSAEAEVMEKFVNDMLAAGALEPAPDAPCSSKAFVVRQGDKARVVVDFASLNRHLFTNANPIPRRDDIIESMASADYEFRSKFDSFGLYYAFEIEPNSRPLTATMFMTKKGPVLLQWVRVALGLSPIPGLLHPLMATLFEFDDDFRQFFDDTNVRHKDEKQCLRDFRRFCAKMQEVGLTISAQKCWVGFRRLEMLGKLVGPGTIDPLPDYLSGFRDLARPTTVKQLQSLLGLVNALTPHLQPRLAQALAPLEEAKGGRGPLVWTNEMERAFIEAKRIMMSPECVVPFDETRPLILITDASNVGGTCTFCHLSRDESRFEVVDSFGHKFSQAERNWRHISQRELLMLLLARRRAPHLLVGRPVYWVNDTFTMSQAIESDRPSSSRRILRTLLEVSDLDIRVVPVKGEVNKIGDALSRNPAWGDDDQMSTGDGVLSDGSQLSLLVAVLDEAIDREEGEVADDGDALRAFNDEFDEAAAVDENGEAVGEEDANGASSTGMAVPQGQPPVAQAAAAKDAEADLQFDLGLSQDVQRARFLQCQHEDRDLVELRAEAERRAQARARGELSDDFEVPDNASWFARLRPELDPFGLLYVCVGDERHWRLVVAKGCREEVLHALHAGAGAGHWGPRRVLATARRFFWWLGMYGHVVRWCQQCVSCQRVRVVPAPGNLGDSEQQGAPVRLRSLVLDSFMIGGEHFLSIVEVFSGLVVAVQLRDQTSASLAQAFEQSWLMYFGAPKSIHSDGGSEFKRHCAALCVARGIELVPGLPYNPESVARVSRAQRTLQTVITKRRAEGSMLPIATLVAEAAEAINTAPSDDQWRVSPHELLFGSAPRLPLVAFMNVDLTGLRETSPVMPLREQLQAHSDTLRALAAVRLEQREEHRKRSEESYARSHGAEYRPEPGDWVWAHVPTDVGKSKDEMLLRWSGPWCVLAFDVQHQRVDMCFVLASGEENALAKTSVHVRRVRPYTRVAPIDDTEAIDKSVVPLDWEKKAAPLGGLSLQPASVQNVLRNAVKVARKQVEQAVAERRRAEQQEREAMQQRAEAERQAQLTLKRQQEEARRAEKEARERELKAERDSKIIKVWDIVRDSDGVKMVVVERNDGSRAQIRRDDVMFTRGGYVRQLVLDLEARVRSRAAGQRAMKVARGGITV